MPPLTLPVLKPEVVPSEASPRSPWRVLLLVGLFLAGFFGTSALVNRILPMAPVALVKDKVDWLIQHGDEYDTFFIGSSRTICHIIPERFDQLMAQAGVPTHSFNLGIFGMRSPEDSYLLETVLAHRHQPLKLILVEANPVSLRMDEGDQATTLRTIYWHDFKRLVALWRATWESHLKGGPFIKLATLRYHTNLFLTKTFALGRGREQVEDWVDVPASTLSKSLGPRRDGSAVDESRERDIPEETWQAFQKKLRKPLRLDYDTRASQLELQAKRRGVEAFGGRMVAFAPPLAGMKVFVPDPKIKPVIPCLNFSVPERYPEFYQRENRFDEGHLNARGAELFTRRLVEQLLEWQKANPAGCD